MTAVFVFVFLFGVYHGSCEAVKQRRSADRGWILNASELEWVRQTIILARGLSAGT